VTARVVERILIVDDEPDIAQVIRLYLERAGLVVAWAEDGPRALRMLEAETYSVVLLDIKMPRMSGVEVLRQIRASGSDAAVIMMTGHGNENLAVECMKSGAIDYFPKPFDLDDMLHRVERGVTHRRILLENRRLEQEKEFFHAMLSHDMKNPMTAAIGSIDLVREGRLGPVTSDQAEYLQSAIDSCNDVLAMINNLLDIQRFAAGKARMAILRHDPAEMITTVVERFSPVARHEEITLTLSLDDNLPEIAVDRNLFARIVGNLVGNALKFTPPGGAVTIRATRLNGGASPVPPALSLPEGFSPQAGMLRISVRDTGSGIPREDLMRIFEPYVQSSGGRREQGGAGLGLAFCRMAVESFGGVIWAESRGDDGSEFVMLLPCCSDELTV
jgi:signal transduction histidine kinase